VSDPYDLQRFVEAQAPVFAEVTAELRAGRKRGHWMWFVFPQLRGLGRSPLAARFGISSLAEAKAYLEHPVLGSRLGECTRMVIDADKRAIEEIFAAPDDLKFRSSMTLFSHAAPDNRVFRDALDKYFGGAPDPLTTERL
jgi:uncharacterized protein (DUF1810 family)